MTAQDQSTARPPLTTPDSLPAPEHQRREQKRTRRSLDQRRRLRTGLALGLTAVAALGAATAAWPVQETGTAQAAPVPALTSLVALARTSAIPGAAASDAGPSGRGGAGQDTGQAAAQPADRLPESAGRAAAQVPPQQERPADKPARAGAGAQQGAPKAAEAGAARTAAQQKATAGKPVDDPAAAKAYASRELRRYGWDASQMPCLDRLWKRESDWLTSATNPGSGAYGIVQSLPADKMASAGPDWRTSYETQIDWGLDYIDGRYGSPCAALQFHHANNWY